MRSFAYVIVVAAGCGGQAASGNGGGSDSECSAYHRPEAASVEVRVTNATDAPVYLATPGGGCEFVPGYTVENTDGTQLIAYLGECVPACSTAQDEYCGCPACGDSGAIMIHPGGTYVDTWTGRLYEEADMPVSCYKDSSCAEGFGCLAEVVPDEPLVFVGTVHPTVDCSPRCECSPTEDGWCDVPAFEGTGEPTTRKVTWSPGDSLVEIVIE